VVYRIRDGIEAMERDLSPVPIASKWLAYPLPVEFPVSSEFGDGAIQIRPTIHEGIDFACPMGVNVMASASGHVVSSHYNVAYGNRVQLEHEHNGDTWFTWYCHLSVLRVVPGQAVISGQQVGLSGATGNVTGPHLHYNVQCASDTSLIYGLPEILRGCRDPRLHVKFP
jgi:murein DD-endopeptidase MepM/ murein hydrolase activator NlpD